MFLDIYIEFIIHVPGIKSKQNPGKSILLYSIFLNFFLKNFLGNLTKPKFEIFKFFLLDCIARSRKACVKIYCKRSE